MKSKPVHTRTITDEMLPFSIERNKGDELFPNGVFEFHISALNSWIDSNENLMKKLELDVDQYYSYFKKSEMNQQYINNADLSRPIILAEISPDRLYHGYPGVTEDLYSRGYNLIDGHHRLHKAHQLGLKTIWAWILPMEQHYRFLSRGFEQYKNYWNDKLQCNHCRG